MRTLENACLWYITRRLRGRPVAVESEADREAREYDELLTKRLELGLMQDTHYYSSSAAEEAKKGPKAVLRNTSGQHIETVTLDSVITA